MTGAARGIGEAVARLFASEGAALILVDRDVGVETVAATLPQARAVLADVSSAADSETMAQAAVDTFGQLDILVNNAGIASGAAFMDTTAAEVERIMRVNLIGTMLCSQAALRRMLPRGYGRIINISSVSGQQGNAGRTAYGASKAAIELMTKVMTAELARPGLTFNAIAPGPIESELTAVYHDAGTRQSFMDRTPMGRYGVAAEVAAAALFLAGETAGYVCGHVLNVDGGFATTGFGPR